MPFTDANVKVVVETDLDTKFKPQLAQAEKQVKEVQRQIDAKWNKMMSGIAAGISVGRQWFNVLARAFRSIHGPLNKVQEMTFDVIGILFDFVMDTAIVLLSMAIVRPDLAIVSVALIGAATLWQLHSVGLAAAGFDEARAKLDSAVGMLDAITRSLMVGLRFG